MGGERTAAEIRQQVLRELGFLDESGEPVRVRENSVYAVTPHLPTLALIAHRMDEFARAASDDPDHPYEDMTPQEALASVIGGIRADVEIAADPSQLVNPEDFPEQPFTYLHQWRTDGLVYEQLGQVRQVCLCGERRTMYATGPCNCARNGLGMVVENSATCVVHPTPGCPNPACGETWIASFHGDHCDVCGWTSPDGASVVDVPARALAWATAVFPQGWFPVPFPDHWATRVTTACPNRREPE